MRRAAHLNSPNSIEMIATPNVNKEPWKLSAYQRGQHEFSRITLFFEQISLEMGWTPGDQIRAYDANSIFLALEARR